MGWREDVQREEKVRELRRQQNEFERDVAFARGLKFDGKKPLELLPSFATGRTSRSSAKPRAIGIMDRGVYRDPFPAEGEAAFVIVDSRGVRRRRVEMPICEVTEDTVPQMWRWLDRVDPLLKVMA